MRAQPVSVLLEAIKETGSPRLLFERARETGFYTISNLHIPFQVFSSVFQQGVSLVDKSPDLAAYANLGFIPLLTLSLMANKYRHKHIRSFDLPTLASWNLSTSGADSWRMWPP